MRRYRLHRVRLGPREITKTKGKSARLSVAGEFSSCSSVLLPLTLASLPALTTWRERLDRSKPPKLHVL